MKIAIDISPILQESQIKHRVRGVGAYIKNLRDALSKHNEHQFIFFDKAVGVPDGAELVHYPYFEPFFLTLPLIKRIPTVVTVHDVTPLVFPSYFPSGMKGGLRWQLQKRLLRMANHIITDSYCSRDDIVKHAGIKEERIKTIYLAASETYKPMTDNVLLTNIVRKYNLPKRFVLYVGDVTWNKNLPRLLKAVEGLDIPLVMVGKALVDENYDKKNAWNQDLSQVQDFARTLSNVLRIGYVSDEELAGLYNLAIVFVMPSLYEGFGLPLIEAMQAGCPVITSREGSIPEVVSDASYSVDAYDVMNIKKGITEVASSVSLQKTLREKGFLQARKFSWQKTANETVMTYEKVLLS